jgi:hypothetical protein
MNVNNVKILVNIYYIEKAKMIDVKGVIFISTSTIMVSFDFFEPADTVSGLLFPFPL